MMKKILIVEDDQFKQEDVIRFLKNKGIEYVVSEYLNDSLMYIRKHKDDIQGIVLDLGLPRFESMEDYDLYMGLNLLKELKRLKLNIPVLINSTTFAGMLDEYPFVYGQRMCMESYEMLEKFVTFLTKREEQ